GMILIGIILIIIIIVRLRLGLRLLSKFGKSGNTIIDDFILKKRLRWIPYNKFKNVEYLNEGGFGIIYKATWLIKNYKHRDVILKCHKNLNENLDEFLKEWEYHMKCLVSSSAIIEFYGFTKDPNTSKYMVVMDYANKGNLRENLTRIVKNNWNQKLLMLYKMISGLKRIHNQKLTHCDFHDGNILNHNESVIYISDLGLCQPVKSGLKKYDIYGVIPFMAPEVLRGKPYTPASDIYSFSMIMWEFTSGIPPFNNRAHDLHLSLSICKGERPEIIENTPQCYVDLMKKCWNEDPLKRPSTSE
ncbi:kinase-like protein, partial [Rhizophagus irregularis]